MQDKLPCTSKVSVSASPQELQRKEKRIGLIPGQDCVAGSRRKMSMIYVLYIFLKIRH